VPPQGAGRIDNPGAYRILFLSDSAAGAIAEAFGRFTEWTRAILEGSPGLPGCLRAMAQYRLAEGAPICNLDHPRQLMALRLPPSDIVSRDYHRTRAWAMRLFEQGRWAGVRWWSYYDPRWSSFGLWDTVRLVPADVTPLALDHPPLAEAARTVVRRLVW
jgi:hypothetical protein